MDRIFSAYEQRLAVLNSSPNPLSKGLAWISGTIVPTHAAQIPMMDQGFMHSDLTYDVPAVWDGRFFRLNDHLNRLERSCTKMRMRLPLPKDEIKRVLVNMVAQSGIRDAFVEIIVTRGMKGLRDCMIEGIQPEDLTNNLYMFVVPYIWVMPPSVQRTGGSAIIARTVRRVPPGSHDPTIKNLQWGDLTRGLIEAMDRNSQYPFLTDGDANVTEGSGFNIVFVKGGKLFSADRGVLEGVTRLSVFDVAKANGVEVRVEVVPVEVAYESEEIFMCTTAGGIMPITTLDGTPVGDGKVGPVTRIIWDVYWAMHWDDKYSFAINYDVAEEAPRARL